MGSTPPPEEGNGDAADEVGGGEADVRQYDGVGRIKRLRRAVPHAARAVPKAVSRGARASYDWASESIDEVSERAAAATETTCVFCFCLGYRLVGYKCLRLG